jgi:environmental stress-induced protein Ves
MTGPGKPSARHLPAAERAVRPWKNGGGETADVAIVPAGASLDDFDWRVSIARVESDGPFSLFPGIDRTMAIIAGEGLGLAVAGREPFVLTAGSAPLRFPADVATECRLLGGPVTDLNVMVRRGRARARLRRLRLEAGMAESFESGPALLLWVEGEGTLEAAGLSVEPARWRLRARSPALAWLAEIS